MKNERSSEWIQDNIEAGNTCVGMGIYLGAVQGNPHLSAVEKEREIKQAKELHVKLLTLTADRVFGYTPGE